MHATIPRIFMWILRIKFQPSHLQGKHFPMLQPIMPLLTVAMPRPVSNSVTHMHPVLPSLPMKFASFSQRSPIGALLAPTHLHLAPDRPTPPATRNPVPAQFCSLPALPVRSSWRPRVYNYEPASHHWVLGARWATQRPAVRLPKASAADSATPETLALTGKADEKACRDEPQILPCSLHILPQLLPYQSQGQEISGMTMAPLDSSVLSLGPQRPDGV